MATYQVSKVAQDTINIIGVINNPPKPFDRIPLNKARYYHLTFYLNKVGEIANYMNGFLNEKIAAIRDNINGKWPLVLGTGYHYLKADSTIYGRPCKGNY